MAIDTLAPPGRSSPEYRAWRRAVFAKDAHACRSCGSTERLEAHHPWPWARFPEFRFDVEFNGETLCHDCHDEHHCQARVKIAAHRLTIDDEIREWNAEQGAIGALGGAWFDGDWIPEWPG